MSGERAEGAENASEAFIPAQYQEVLTNLLSQLVLGHVHRHQTSAYPQLLQTLQQEVQDAQTAGQNVGFALRWGSPGQYRYARVMVVAAAGGNLIKTDSNGDPYVEVQFSYQDAPGVPYAKGN